MASSIYTPQNPSPRNEVRDMDNNQDFTAIIDGVKCTDYQIRIYKVSDNSLVHDTTKLNLSPALSDGATLTHTLTGGTIANTGTDSYKWTIQVWNDAETVTSREFQFFAKTTPVLAFTPDNPITTQSYEFTATLTQAEGDIVNTYTFELYDSNDELLETSGLITSFNIAYTFDGFTNGDSLKIRLDGTTTGGDTFDTGLIAFTVSYSEPEIDLIPEAVVDNETSLITVTRPDAVQILGIDTPSGVTYEEIEFFRLGLSGAVTYTVNVVDLLDGQNIDFQNLTTSLPVSVPEEFTLEFIWYASSSSFEGKIIELGNNEYVVGFEEGFFYYTINGVTNYIANARGTLFNGVYVFILMPTEVVIYEYELNQPIMM